MSKVSISKIFVLEQFWQITSSLFSKATLSSWSVHTLSPLIGHCQTENWYDNSQRKISPNTKLSQIDIFNCCWGKHCAGYRKHIVQIFNNLHGFCGQIFWKVAWQRLTRGLTFCWKTKHFCRNSMKNISIVEFNSFVEVTKGVAWCSTELPLESVNK